MARFSARNARRFIGAITAVSVLLVAQPALAGSPDDDALTAIDPLQTGTIVAAASPSKLQGKSFKPGDFDTSGPHVAPYAFKLVDPSTGKALPVDAAGKLVHPDTIITNQAGTKVKASDYWNSTYELEHLANNQGHSLHENLTSYSIGRLKHGVQSEIASSVKLVDVPDTAVLSKGVSTQKAEAALPSPTPPPYNSNAPDGTPPPFNGTVTTVSSVGTPEPPPDTLKEGYKSEQRKKLKDAPPDAPNPTYKSLTFDKTGGWSGGSQDIAAVALTPYLHAEPKDGNLDVSTGIDLNAYLFGSGAIDIASVALKVAPPSGSANVTVMGSSIYSNSGYPLKDQKTFTATFFSVSSNLNPSSSFNITVSGSAQGEIGVDYEVAEDTGGSDGPKLAGSLVPFATVAGSMDASLSAGNLPGTNATISVDAALTIAKVSLPFALSMYYRIQTSRTGTEHTEHNIYACQARFVYALSSEMAYTFLSGTISVALTACVVTLCDVIFKVGVASYPGFSGNVTIAKFVGDSPASDVYSDLPEYGYAMPKSGGPFAYSSDDSSGKPAACSAMENKLKIKTLKT